MAITDWYYHIAVHHIPLEYVYGGRVRYVDAGSTNPRSVNGTQRRQYVPISLAESPVSSFRVGMDAELSLHRKNRVKHGLIIWLDGLKSLVAVLRF